MIDNVELINWFIALIALYVISNSKRLFKIKIFSVTSKSLVDSAITKQRLKLEKMENTLHEMNTITDLHPKLIKSTFMLIYFIKLIHVLLIVSLGIIILLNIN